MFRRFPFRYRSLFAMLLAFCLVSASLWAYGAEAMGDILSDEIAVATIGEDAGDHSPVGVSCNHGCHAQTHLTGLSHSVLTLSLSNAVAIFSINGSIDVSTQFVDGLFRPPRNLFQA